MSEKFSCIIPFYNEGRNTILVISEVLKVDYINQIICVDDGSSDGVYKEIIKRFPKVDLIRFVKNSGKSNAVFTGLKKAVNDNLVLLDADLENFKNEDLTKAIEKYIKAKNLDVLIFKMSSDYELINDVLRQNIVLGGNRIIKKSILTEVEKEKPHGYQLEVSSNDYLIKNRKKVKWIKCQASLPHKMRKTSLVRGMLGDFKMDKDIIDYLGLVKYIKQIIFFCREELK